MPASLEASRARYNGARWSGGPGHYESWFQRANHPSRPLGLWVRYTIFAPLHGPPEGELWAIWFDGEAQRVTAAKSVHAIDRCRFERDRLDVDIDGSILDARHLVGTCDGAGHRIAWSLAFTGDHAPLLLIPEAMYDRGFPKAKMLVGSPLCRYAGHIDVDGEHHEIDGWLGSQNHNWGSRHTDRYAWGQVAGFDGRDDAMLECGSGKLRMGPLWTPWLTVAVLRLADETFAFNALGRTPFARASVEGLRWSFDTSNGRERLRAVFEGDAARFVGLGYRNPPGGTRICLNSKIARASIELDRPGRPTLALHSEQRAAFELLRDDPMGIPVVA